MTGRIFPLMIAAASLGALAILIGSREGAETADSAPAPNGRSAVVKRPAAAAGSQASEMPKSWKQASREVGPSPEAGEPAYWLADPTAARPPL